MENTALVPLADTMQLGKVLADSGFFSDSRQAAQAVVKVLAGRELGFGPVASMTGINIIQGRVSLSANMIAAAVKRSGRYDYRVTTLTDDLCVIDFFEKGAKIGSSQFTESDATKAGTQNMKKFPRNMLFARAMSNGAKWYCADIFGGPIYTPDELGANVNEEGEIIEGESRRITTEPVTVSAPAAAQPTQPTQPGNGNCPECGQTVAFLGHAPGCSVGKRNGNGYTPEPPASDVSDAERMFDEMRSTTQERAEQKPKREMAGMVGSAVKTFPAWCKNFVKVFPYYAAKGGQPDMVHILRAVMAEHFDDVTPDNQNAVCKALEVRAEAKVAGKEVAGK